MTRHPAPALPTSNSTPAAKDRLRWGLILTAVGLTAIALRGLVGWDPGRPLSQESPELFVASDTSPLYISGLAALFLYLRWYRLRSAIAISTPSPMGWLLLAPGAALFGWSQYTGTPDLTLLSAIPIVLGGALVAAGAPFTRVLALPVLFLLFAFPIPAVLANQQVYTFQLATAQFATWIVDALGVPVVREGDLIYTRGHAFEVIETCSGLRLTETLITSAFAYGELMGTRLRHKVLLVLCAPVLGFLLNAVRVLLIMFNPVSDYSADHTLQGIVVLVAGVLSFAAIERVAIRFWPGSLPGNGDARGHGDAHTSGPEESDDDLAPTSQIPRPWALPVVAAALLAASIAVPQWKPGPLPTWTITMPIDFDGWVGSLHDLDSQFLGSVYYSRFLHRRYEQADRWVEVLAAADNRVYRDRSIFSEKNALPGSGYRILGEREIQPDWTESTVREIVAVRRGQRVLIYHWYEDARPLGAEIRRSFAALENSRMRTPGEVRMFRVVTKFPDNPEQRLGAAHLVNEFAQRIRSSLDG